ncbi:uncharacterized protein [Rutidosis leptorrhynchoides]|uniref:uncharacterized protein isoform X2 n=1 Tax=Rutidosis leptorrhynchoides TaxID=125765 RepID=UPI003A99EB89
MTTEMDGTHTLSTTNNLIVREGPPADDCCPICFGSFSAPCRGPCGHWYCGGCIMEYWNHVAAFHPCKCPMCSRPISKLTPESTLSYQQDPGIREVLRNVKQYNCLFAGGACGFIMVFLGALYTLSPFDFLPRWRYLDAIDLFDCSAIALSFSLYFVGLYTRRRRLRHLRQLAPVPHFEVDM